MNKESVESVAVNHPAAAPPVDPSQAPIAFDISPDLSPSDRKLVEARLHALAPAFAASSRTPAASPGVQHTIHLTDPQPVKSAPYKQSPLKQAVVHETVKKGLASGVMVNSDSPWASPVSLVPKGPPDPVTGKTDWRMVIDYRRVNAKTRKDAYPVPLIEDCLAACKNADWLSIIDIKDAYHHILMALESRGITAFVTPDGLFEWTRMPFGLSNAPATFQRYVDMQLREFIGKFCAVFFDDCLVYTTGTLTKHMDEVTTVLSKLHSVNLEASASKCRFAYKELLFVGHIVGKGTIKPDPEKIKAILEFPRPSTVTELKGFLGLANYYRRFIDGFASIANPLYDMLKKGVAWDWSQNRLTALENLKQALVNSKCLYAPNHRLPFILQTDASGIGISGILSQNVEGEEHPVGFVSRQLNKAEKNYTTTEWECLAVVWSIGQFEPFLIDKPFTIVTDHSALQWLATKKMENKRLTRWALTLQEYSYTILHRPGKANANADALSRSPLAGTAPAEVPVGLERETLVSGTRQAHFIRTLKGHKSGLYRSPAPSAPSVDPEAEEYEFTSIDISDYTRAIAAQYTDPPLRLLIDYLQKHELPATYTPIERTQFTRRAASYQLVDVGLDRKGLFYYPSAPRASVFASRLPPRFVVPSDYQEHIMNIFHSSPFGGHSGITRTLRKISARYYWTTLYPDVVKYVSTCDQCATSKHERHRPALPTGRLPDPAEPWEVVSIDFAGPLPDCDGFRYILLFVDHFTQYCVAIPTADTQAGTALRALTDQIICRFGMPFHVLSDRGSSFNNDAFLSLSKVLGYKMHLTAGRHPQANGKTERFVGTLKSTLTTALAEREGHWVDALGPAVFAINASPSTLTGLSPYFLNHGREPVFPGEGGLALSRRVDDARSEDSGIESYALVLASAIDWGLRQVRNVHEARAQSTEEYNQSIAKVPVYAEGDAVYLLDSRADSRTGGHTLPAFVHPFIGPYRVMKRIGPTTYLVRGYHKGKATGTQLTAPVSRMRPARGPAPEETAASAPQPNAKDPRDTSAPAASKNTITLQPFTPLTSTPSDEDMYAASESEAADEQEEKATPPATVGSSVHQQHRGKYRPNYSETAVKLPSALSRPEARYSSSKRGRKH